MTTNFTLPTRVDKESYVPCQNDRESSPPHYILDNEFHNPHNHIFFTKKGEMPHVSFEQNEIYRVVEKYYYMFTFYRRACYFTNFFGPYTLIGFTLFSCLCSISSFIFNFIFPSNLGILGFLGLKASSLI